MTRNRTTIEFWEENNSWHATEPRADADLVGRGQTPIDATANYIELLDESVSEEAEVPVR